MKKLGAGLFISATIAAVPSMAILGTSGGAHRMHVPSPPVALEKIAAKIAYGNGATAPSVADFVLTDRASVAAVYQAKVDTDPSVYLVVLHGHFTDHNARVPPGSSAPTGTIIAFSVEANTGIVDDFVIGNQAPELASLGSVGSFNLVPSAQP